MRSVRRTAFALIAGLALSLAVQTVGEAAQTVADPVHDWTFSEDAAHKSTIAIIGFNNGITVAARCIDNDFEVILSGLPESDSREVSRKLEVSIGDEPLAPETWSLGVPSSTMFSRLPAPFARRLAEGGRFQIRVTGAAGHPATRYVMSLSPSANAVERTLTACGRPLVDRRDILMGRDATDGLSTAGTPESRPVWDQRPRPTYPTTTRFGQQAAEGFVTLSCETQDDGRLTDCVIESEHPAGFGFGRAAVQGALRARLRQADGNTARLGGGVVVYATGFRIR